MSMNMSMQNTNLILQEPDALSWLVEVLVSPEFLGAVLVAVMFLLLLKALGKGIKKGGRR